MPLIKAAIAHEGAAFIDVISPCVAFNNHAGSTKSYDYVREHNEAVNRLDFSPTREAITDEYAAGSVHRSAAARRLHHAPAQARTPTTTRPTASRAMNTSPRPPPKGEVLTGLLYVAPDAEDLHAHLNTFDARSTSSASASCCPGSAALEKINARLR